MKTFSILSIVLAAGILACGKDGTGPGGSNTVLAIVAGDSQIVGLGQTLPIDPAVQVRDDAGNPLAGVTVTFTVQAGGGETDPDNAQVTDSSGVATVPSWTLGTTGSHNALRAAVQGKSVTIFAYGVTRGIAAGGFFSCGLALSGVFCWGDNNHGQLGNNSTTDRLSPVAVGGGVRFVALTAGWEHACGLTILEEAYCWGRNSEGQLGDNTTTDRGLPTPVAGLRFKSIAAEGNHTCGITRSGVAFCWGDNEFGSLGDGTLVNRLVPTQVQGGIQFASIALGFSHTCGVSMSSLGYCWGSNEGGQLGDGTSTSRSAPTPIFGGLAYTDLSLGLFHSCGLVVDGSLLCWGDNDTGQLGDGSLVPRLSPTPAGGATNFSVILALGFKHSCGRSVIGPLYCWGENGNGQLGDATTTSHPSPALLSGNFDAGSIAAGGYHTCAISGGAAYCWGYNSDGQLGDNSQSDRSVPTAVSGGLQFVGPDGG